MKNKFKVIDIYGNSVIVEESNIYNAIVEGSKELKCPFAYIIKVERI